MSKPTFEQRCLLAEQCLPDAPYREMLKKLHKEMLEALAAQPAVQEPIAWTVTGNVTNWSKDFSAYKTKHYTRPVYTTPPAAQRQWVGLTDEEFEDIELGCRSTVSGKIMAMQKVEAKLKEKNT
jgi:hypothetical protein